MSNIWKFSSLSTPYVDKWLQKAITIDNNNKWSEKFKNVNKTYLEYHNVKKLNEECVIEDIAEEMSITENTTDIPEEEVLTKENYDEFFIVINSEPLLRFDYMIEQCLNNPYLITELAEHLTTDAIEKICNNIFTNKNINTKFISKFIVNFFPPFLKRNRSRLAIDLLIKVKNTYPNDFKTLLIQLINKIDINNSILQELLKNSNLQEHFILILKHVNTSDVFLHHLYSIYMIYKDIKKTDCIQSLVQSLLVENSTSCINNKDYGRLLLLFIQTEKSLGATNSIVLQKLIEQHETQFKRYCLSVLNEMK